MTARRLAGRACACVCALVLGARTGAARGEDAWTVPSWDARLTAPGAVREWSGKVWCGHVQGMCVTSNALYFSFHNQILKTDWEGRLLVWAPAVRHCGDICHWKGKLYTCGGLVKPDGKPGTGISRYDAETLRLERVKTLPGKYGLDGITCLDGALIVGMGKIDPAGHVNRFGRFDAETLEMIGEPFEVDHGEDSRSGPQNICTDGERIYVNYYCPDESADTPCFIVFDKAFNVLEKHVFGWRQGVDVVPGGRDGAVRFIYCDTINWMTFGKPTLPVQALTLFAERRDGRIRDITRHCIFVKPLAR